MESYNNQLPLPLLTHHKSQDKDTSVQFASAHFISPKSESNLSDSELQPNLYLHDQLLQSYQ